MPAPVDRSARTVHDRAGPGRWGFQSRGVPVSGAMDRYSHRLANRLVGNADDAATLEVTLVGPQIAFEEDISLRGCRGDRLSSR